MQNYFEQLFPLAKDIKEGKLEYREEEETIPNNNINEFDIKRNPSLLPPPPPILNTPNNGEIVDLNSFSPSVFNSPCHPNQAKVVEMKIF